DLGGQHQRRGRAPGPAAVVAADDLRQRHGRLAPHPAGEEETEGQEAGGAGEIEPETRDPVDGNVGGKGDRGRASGGQRGQAEEAPERPEAAVGYEVRRLARGGAAPAGEADREHGREIGGEQQDRQEWHGGKAISRELSAQTRKRVDRYRALAASSATASKRR